jgi:hypothetical protein
MPEADMGIKLKSFVSALALGFALLAFGPATSAAKADHLRHFAPGRHHVRPYRRFAPRAAFVHPRPYRVVRVLIYDPFPRWVYRRVYTGPYYAGAYCPY